jgi:hypothetical protein
MNLYYVFKYSFDAYLEGTDESNKKVVEKVSTHAVAVLPAHECTVLLGGGSSWVFHAVPGGVDSYLIDGEIESLEGVDAIAQAKTQQRLLTERGTIAPDPRILKPPKNYSPLKLAK